MSDQITRPVSRYMKAVVTTGWGGLEKLSYRDVVVPSPSAGEVLLQVLAAAVNNTDINTRIGWYSSEVKTGTSDASSAHADAGSHGGGWNAVTAFPLIQGTDCCGRVVALGAGAPRHLIGKRVLVRSCMRKVGFGSLETVWLGSDFDGAFAQYVKVPATEVFPVDCRWSDAELGSIPCAYGTAENMLHRTGLKRGEHVLVMGASGGVGSATVQLSKRRGAHVTAVVSGGKGDIVRAIGADRVIERGADLAAVLGTDAIDLAVDNVAGETFGAVLSVLRRGGRYATSGAIGGPLVGLDMRHLYLRDVTLFGSTAWDEPIFPALVSYIEAGEISPLVARTYPLDEIVRAQTDFMAKAHVGKLVLVPPTA
jgi:NADPH:quinone reductase-like Zn-dependent oxidoreductase